MASEPFIITSKPHGKRIKGFPLDSLSIDIRTGKYYYDLEDIEPDSQTTENGIVVFLKRFLV